MGLNALTCAVTDEEPVGLTAVYNTIHRCNYEKARTKNVPQTNIKNEIYRQARYNWFAQFLARLGEKIPEDDDSEYRKRLKNEWIDYDKLKEEKLNMELSQIGFWDECHIKQFVGCDNDETYIFARDENGLYDENGEIDEEGNRKVSTYISFHFLQNDPFSSEINISFIRHSHNHYNQHYKHHHHDRH